MLFQAKMNFKIRAVNLYNISLEDSTAYPHYSRYIYEVGNRLHVLRIDIIVNKGRVLS